MLRVEFVANPKSINFTTGELFLKERRILSGLISRWETPNECRYYSPLRTSFMINIRSWGSLNFSDMCLKYYWRVIDSLICSNRIWIFIMEKLPIFCFGMHKIALWYLDGLNVTKFISLSSLDSFFPAISTCTSHIF